MTQSFNVNFSFKLKKGGKIYTREYVVLADDERDAKLQVRHSENRGCYRFRINSVTPAVHRCTGPACNC